MFRPRPRPLTAAAVVVAAQGAALVGACVAYLVAILTGHPSDLTTALFSDALGFLAAAVLLLLARPLGRARRFSRAPVVILELLAVPVAVDLVQVARLAAGLAVGVPAVLVLGLLLTPSARAPFASAWAGGTDGERGG